MNNRPYYYFSYLEPTVEEMESNDKEAVDDGFESFDSEDFEDAGQVFFGILLQKLSWPTVRDFFLKQKTFCTCYASFLQINCIGTIRKTI